MMNNSGNLIVLSIFLIMVSGHQHFPPPPPPHHQHYHQQQHHYQQEHHHHNNNNNNNNNNDNYSYNNNNNNINTINQVSPAQQQWPFVKSNFSQYNIQVQSPTNINTSCVTQARLTPVTIHLLRNITGECVTIENTGYYLEMRLIPGLRTIPYVTGGPLLRERYLFEQMHFHWGPTDRCGSEHRVDGKCFSMEVHIVLYNEKYGSNSEATRYPDGLTVISFFGETAPQDNPSFKDLINKMSLITEPESNTTGSFQKEFNFLNILFHATTYYTYPGSLTTPPYSECVTWIMYPQTPFSISPKQISAFRKLRNSEGRTMIRGNDRPLQPFGNRPMRQPLANGELEVVDRFNGAGRRMQNGQSQNGRIS